MGVVRETHDCVVVGASFAGLGSAYALARSGLGVTVLEDKADCGERPHTTGILVKDVIDQVALLDRMPAELVRRIDGVRLYAPDLHYVDLAAPGYYFLATDTPGVLRWLAEQAENGGARLRLGARFRGAERTRSGFRLEEAGLTRYLIGADGPRSRVAESLGLGHNSDYLFGVEYEYADVSIPEPDKLHCFIDRRIAPGYIGWIVSGVGLVQAGLARRLRGERVSARAAMTTFLEKIAPMVDLRGRRPCFIRAGLIPCGGVVRPAAGPRVLLVGDAAGMVSPVTAGGIHAALKHGLAAGHAVADFLHGRAEDPSDWFVRTYPRYRAKRSLRFLFDHFQSDMAFNRLLATRPMRMAAGSIYFHHKGVFVPSPTARSDHGGGAGPRRIPGASCPGTTDIEGASE
ncbi:MAG: NAD(P)/FAD-dependent oxidoreductase [Actinobacteria bacterium]|nr:NAD(P)/FAD-dependent oxidoreductase [Actinomycetota bacterium]